MKNLRKLKKIFCEAGILSKHCNNRAFEEKQIALIAYRRKVSN